LYRLRAEKEALGNLLATPAVPSSRQIESSLLSDDKNLDHTLLSETDIAALDSLPRSVTSSDQISRRLNGLYNSLGPTIDKFADGIHTIGQYRQAADNVASRALAICAERLSQREKEGRKRALPEAQGTPPKDLGGVLRSLSRADR
jgi:kinetochore protein Mis13/DSN1